MLYTIFYLYLLALFEWAFVWVGVCARNAQFRREIGEKFRE